MNRITSLAAALLVSSLCVDSRAALAQADAPPAKPAHGEKPAADAKPAIAAPRVKVLEPGGADKKPLRYAFARGAESAVEMRTMLDMSVSFGGAGMPQPLPDTTFTIQMKVNDIDDKGIAHCAFTYTKADALDDPSVPAAQTQMTRQSLKSMVGAGGTMAVNNRGMVSEIDFNAPEGADAAMLKQLDQMKMSLTQLCMPLPEEAVGMGGKWQVRNVITAQGITIEQVTIYTLESMNGNALKLAIEIKQVADEQEAELPDLPGTKLLVRSMDGKGTGTCEADLGSLFPIASSMKLSSDTAIAVPDMNDLKQRLDMTTEAKIVPVEAAVKDAGTKSPAATP